MNKVFTSLTERFLLYLAYIPGLILAYLFFPVSAFAATPVATGLSDKPSLVSGDSLFGMMFSLVFILVVIFMIAWAARRFGGSAFKGNSALKIMAGISMGAREKVVLVQVGDQQLLLGVAPGRVQTLHVLDKPIDFNSTNSQGNSAFADRLKSVLNKSR